MADVIPQEEQALHAAYQTYVSAQVALWSKRFKHAKENLEHWQLQLECPQVTVVEARKGEEAGHAIHG